MFHILSGKWIEPRRLHAGNCSAIQHVHIDPFSQAFIGMKLLEVLPSVRQVYVHCGRLPLGCCEAFIQPPRPPAVENLTLAGCCRDVDLDFS